MTTSAIITASIIAAITAIAIALVWAVAQDSKRAYQREMEERQRKAANECPHIWQPWAVTRTARRFDDGSKLPSGINIYQARRCDMCGLTESKKEEV